MPTPCISDEAMLGTKPVPEIDIAIFSPLYPDVFPSNPDHASSAVAKSGCPAFCAAVIVSRTFVSAISRV